MSHRDMDWGEAGEEAEIQLVWGTTSWRRIRCWWALGHDKKWGLDQMPPGGLWALPCPSQGTGPLTRCAISGRKP